ncbi:hypothetical protein M0804_014829 [Polistes exclamans]|nr:hypothetical protein M0804_014832 [Polistes exclamans]KAI4474493.1 hypothetical protein M0804_014829 [Polistes exclamans]
MSSNNELPFDIKGLRIVQTITTTTTTTITLITMTTTTTITTTMRNDENEYYDVEDQSTRWQHVFLNTSLPLLIYVKDSFNQITSPMRDFNSFPFPLNCYESERVKKSEKER